MSRSWSLFDSSSYPDTSLSLLYQMFVAILVLHHVEDGDRYPEILNEFVMHCELVKSKYTHLNNIWFLTRWNDVPIPQFICQYEWCRECEWCLERHLLQQEILIWKKNKNKFIWKSNNKVHSTNIKCTALMILNFASNRWSSYIIIEHCFHIILIIFSLTNLTPTSSFLQTNKRAPICPQKMAI